jgi:signal transduction histidine kinase
MTNAATGTSLALAEDERLARTIDRGSATEGASVLIVDDTEGNRYTVARLLRGIGMVVSEAETAAQARAALAASRFDLVVLDINLPDESGHAVLESIRSSPVMATLPVMHVTASYTSSSDRAFGLEHGADAYLTHPLDPDIFIATVRALLRAEGERARLYQAERAARTAAEEASRAKTELLSTLSHELRTPLNSVRGHLGLLEADVYGPLTDPQRVALARAQRSAVYLTGLINDLLNFSRLESGHVDFDIEDVPLSGPQSLIVEIEALVATQAAAKGIAVRVPDQSAAGSDVVCVRADADKVRIILANLVTNAIKFTESGGRVSLVLDAAPGSEVVTVRVSDTGRGIAAEQLERVFEPFVQLDRHRTHESQQGVGLGLAISRTLARAMGGDLTAESVVGSGSTLTLSLRRSTETWEPGASDLEPARP